MSMQMLILMYSILHVYKQKVKISLPSPHNDRLFIQMTQVS
jgi:hypothetical protein